MGQTVVSAPLAAIAGNDVIAEERDLTGKGNKKGETMPGKIFVEYETYDDLLQLWRRKKKIYSTKFFWRNRKIGENIELSEKV